MIADSRWPRILVIVGLVGMAVGMLDPLEGSIVIIPAIAIVAAGLALGHKKERRILYLALALAGAGVAVMVYVSSLGGFGGQSGRSMWWALAIAPYPIGWLLGIIGAIQGLRSVGES